MKKKFFIIIIFLFIASCGFSPIHNLTGLQNISINVSKYSGDNDLNNLFNFIFKKYNKSEVENKFNLQITTNYSKIILSKNKSGTPENYNLILNVKFEISREKLNKVISFSETYEIKNIDNKYDETTYERNIKENFSKKATQKLILELRNIK